MFQRAAALRGLWRNHRAFAVILGAGVLVRVAAMLAYRPALWYSDSLSYAATGMRPYPTTIRPAGYPLMLLWPLHRYHSFALVVAAQHALGLLGGTLVYLLLRRRGLPGWAAVLASAPVLLSAYEIQIEHFVLSDSLFSFLIIAAITGLLWSQAPGWLQSAIAGLSLGAATIVRTEGLPLVVPVAVWLLTRNRPWRARAASTVLVCLCFGLPVAGYALWFQGAHGQLRLTYSTGAFLAARMESFSSCAGIRVPPDERWLCTRPGRKPDWYLWAGAAPLHHSAGGEFSVLTDRRATAFAVHLAEAHPGDYLLASWRAFLQDFSSGGYAYGNGQQSFAFPARTPETAGQLARANAGNPAGPIYSYDARPSTRVYEPWAEGLQVYQQLVVFPPIVVGMIMMAGLGSVVLGWKRRGGPALLPWSMGIVMLAFPAMTSGFGSRYELVSVAPFFMAAVLGFAELKTHHEPSVSGAATARPDLPASSGPASPPCAAQPATGDHHEIATSGSA